MPRPHHPKLRGALLPGALRGQRRGLSQAAAATQARALWKIPRRTVAVGAAAEWDTPRFKVSGSAKEWGPSVAALVKRAMRGKISAECRCSASREKGSSTFSVVLESASPLLEGR